MPPYHHICSHTKFGSQMWEEAETARLERVLENGWTLNSKVGLGECDRNYCRDMFPCSLELIQNYFSAME